MTPARRPKVELHAEAGGTARAEFLADVRAGLGGSPKTLPSKHLYDEAGSTLFDQICELDEYYVTRTELAIMEEHAPSMAARLGAGCLVLEYGSGTSMKTHALLGQLPRPVAYAPIDVARDHLLDASARIAEAYPDVDVLPVWGDFTREYEVPEPAWGARRRIVYFPGSTIGNFTRGEASDLLHGIARLCGTGGALLVGTDLVKPREVLERAYSDGSGVTAAFNLNLLTRINRELDGDFDLDCFRHVAPWNEDEERIEMHLESLDDQFVTIGGERFAFERGETIRTEYSHKFRLDRFASLAHAAGLQVRRVWSDADQWFAVQYLEVT